MRIVRVLVMVVTAGCLLQTARGETAILVVRTDLECRLSVDGEARGVLKAGEEIRVSVEAGEHRVAAAPVDATVATEAMVEIKGDAHEVTIPLRAAVERAGARKRGYWVDAQTQLMWPAADNGFGVSAAQAAYYCRTLSLGGYTGWTLPTIDQLRALFGGPANESGHHVSGPTQLTGWQWSASPGLEPGQQWALDFGDGARASVVMGDSGLNRALCVRPAGK